MYLITTSHLIPTTSCSIPRRLRGEQNAKKITCAVLTHTNKRKRSGSIAKQAPIAPVFKKLKLMFFPPRILWLIQGDNPPGCFPPIFFCINSFMVLGRRPPGVSFEWEPKAPKFFLKRILHETLDWPRGRGSDRLVFSSRKWPTPGQ